jgi:hypothetical protein
MQMSVATIARRTRAAPKTPVSGDLTNVRTLAQGGDRQTDKADKSTLSNALETLTGYIPGDVIALFMFVVTTLNGRAGATEESNVYAMGFWLGIAMCLFIVATDRVAQWRKGEAISGLATGWALVAGLSAFTVWAAAMPESRVAEEIGLPWDNTVWAIVAVVWSMALVRLAPLFEPEPSGA